MNMARAPNDVAYVTTSQMIEVDGAMVEDFKIALIQMMESAGRNLTHLARVRFLGRTCGTRAASCWRGAAATAAAPVAALD